MASTAWLTWIAHLVQSARLCHGDGTQCSATGSANRVCLKNSFRMQKNWLPLQNSHTAGLPTGPWSICPTVAVRARRHRRIIAQMEQQPLLTMIIVLRPNRFRRLRSFWPVTTTLYSRPHFQEAERG